MSTSKEYLGAVRSTDVNIDYGTSEIFTEDELKEAVVQIKCEFASWADCELHSIRYAGDEFNNEENLARMNELGEGTEYVQCAEFLMDLHSPVETNRWTPDNEYTDFKWELAQMVDGGFDIITHDE